MGSEPGPARPSLDPPPHQQPPSWAPALIQLSGQTAMHSPTQHSPGRCRGQASTCLCAVWPGWGWEKGGSARGSLGVGDGHQVGALGLSIASPVAVVKALVQLCEPLDTVVQQPQPRRLCGQL